MMPAFVKLLSVALVFLALGVPVNRLPEFLVFVAALFLMIFGVVRVSPWRVLLAFGLVIGATTFARLIEPPAIDEGFNVFLFEADPGALRGLPPKVLAEMEGDLRPVLDRYRCDKAEPGCWRYDAVTPERVHVFSGDGALDAAPGFSRQVRDIGFRHRDQLFSAAINRFPRHNSYGAQSNPDRQRLPVFVSHRFPQSYEGSTLCWTGMLARPSEGRADILRSPDREQCLVLDGLDRRPLTIAYGIDPALPFAMRLDRTWSLALRDGAARAAVILAVIAALALLVDFRLREPLLVPALAFGGTLVWAVGWDLGVRDSALLDGLNIYRGGNDGLVHDSLAREVLFQAASGNWVEALKGSEAVFYFQPGLRYALAIGKFLFGETHYFYLILVALVPVIVHRILRLLVPPRWAMALLLVFLFTPLFEKLGFSHYNFIHQLHRGQAEPLGYGALLAAMAILLPAAFVSAEPEGRRRSLAFAGGLLLALAVAVRPNLVPGAAVIAAGTSLGLLRKRDVASVLALGLGGSTIFVVLLHNIALGGRFVLLSDVSTNPFNLKMTPQAYWDALRALLALNFQAEAWVRMTAQLKDWNSLGDIWRLPLFFATLYALVRRQSPPILRVIAGAAVAQHALLFFYNAGGRYAFMAWMLSFMTFVVVFREDILPALQGRFGRFRSVQIRGASRAA